MEDNVMLASALSGTVGNIFGYRFHEGGSNGLVTIYVEDDEQWFPKMTFDVFWLPEFVKLAEVAKATNPYSGGELV